MSLVDEHLVQIAILILSVIVVVAKGQTDYEQVVARCIRLEAKNKALDASVKTMFRAFSSLEEDVSGAYPEDKEDPDIDWDEDAPF